VAGWVLLSLLGFAIGSMLVFVGGWALVDTLHGDAERVLDDGLGFFLYLTAAFTMGGVGWATGQWLLLRRRVPQAGRWILGGAVGFAVLTVGYFALSERVPELASEVLHNLAGGAAMALIQIPVVRRLTGRGNAGVPIAAVALVVAGLVSMAVRAAGGTDDLGGPLGIVAASLITGVVLSGWIAATGRNGAAPTARHGASPDRISSR
jgi:hypothetical protein